MVNELPEKWCINVNNETVTNYFKNQSGKNCYTLINFSNGYYHRFNSFNQDIMIKGSLGASFHSSYIREEFIEITFEDFERLVLKTPSNIELKLW